MPLDDTSRYRRNLTLREMLRLCRIVEIPTDVFLAHKQAQRDRYPARRPRRFMASVAVLAVGGMFATGWCVTPPQMLDFSLTIGVLVAIMALNWCSAADWEETVVPSDLGDDAWRGVPAPVAGIAKIIIDRFDNEVYFLAGALYRGNRRLGGSYLLVVKNDPSTGLHDIACIGVWTRNQVVYLAES